MSDDFLYSSRPDVPAQFADALYDRLLAIDASTDRAARPPRRLSRPLVLLLVTVAAMASVLATIPEARAQIIERVHRIGEMIFYEVELVHFTPPPPYTPGPGESTPVPPRHVDAATALKAFPVKISLPSWVPSGYVLSDVELEQGEAATVPNVAYSSVRFIWKKSSQPTPSPGPYGSWTFWLILSVSSPASGGRAEVPLNAVEEVTVHGLPAAVVRGSINGLTGKWDVPVTRLSWSDKAASYSIEAPSDIPLPELLRMAESMY